MAAIPESISKVVHVFTNNYTSPIDYAIKPQSEAPPAQIHTYTCRKVVVEGERKQRSFATT